MADDHFYNRLPLHDMLLSRLLGVESAFVPVPEDWHVVVTDIKSSTHAVQTGAHDLVNLVATGSIIAALNLAYRRELRIPFFFGGDGATLILPASLLKPVMRALNEHRQNSIRNFDLDLRVGQVPVRDLYAAGQELRIAQIGLNELFFIPVVLGGGLRHAERLIKAADPADPYPEAGETDLDLEGMECRWDRVKPPEDRQEILCLLVDVCDDRRQAAVFQQVLAHIDEVFGPYASRQPISTKRLRLKATLAKIETEMRVRMGRFHFGYLLRVWLQTLIGKWYFFVLDKTGRAYLRNFAKFADTLTIDGRINTVISGTAAQREQLRSRLDQLEQAGEIWYGLHTSAESVMSCYVRDRIDQHIHFVDGSEGGYTQAAKMLKQKMAN